MALTRHRFIVLFAALVAFYVLAPILQQWRRPGWPPILEGVLFVALLTGTILSILRARTGMWVAIGLALPARSGRQRLGAHRRLAIAREAFVTAFLLYAIGVVLRYVFHSHHVTYDTVCAAVRLSADRPGGAWCIR